MNWKVFENSYAVRNNLLFRTSKLQFPSKWQSCLCFENGTLTSMSRFFGLNNKISVHGVHNDLDFIDYYSDQSRHDFS